MRTYKYMCNDKARYKSSTKEVIKSVWRGCGSWRRVFKMYIEGYLSEDKGCTYARKTEGNKFIWFSSVQSLSYVRLFVTPWTAAGQPSLSITNFQSLLKLMSIESAMSCNHPILCCSLLLLPSIFPRAFSNESVLHIGWQKYGSFSFSISPSNEYSGLISFRIDWFDLLADSQESSPTSQFKSISCSALSFLYGPALISIYDYWKNHSFD